MAQEGRGLNKHARIWVTLWCVIALPPLALLLALLWATFMHRPQPVNTGDALLDAYLQAAVDENLLLRSMRYGDILRWESLSERQWQSVEQRFGEDPRYWMLRYYVDAQADAYLSPIAQVQLDSPVRYLEQARDRGCADWKILYALAQAYHEAWWNEAIGQLGNSASRPGVKATSQQRYEYLHKVRMEVDRRHGKVLDPLLAQLAACGGDQAQVRYLLAQYKCERGDFPGALAELSTGNKLHSNTNPVGFPLDALRQAAAQGLLLAGDSILNGYLIRLDDYSALPFIRSKDMVRVLAEWASDRGEIAAIHELHTYGCRFSSAQNSTTMSSLAGLTQVATATKALERARPQPSSKQQQARIQARKLRLQIVNQHKSLNNSSPLNSLGTQQNLQQYVQDLAIGNEYDYLLHSPAWSQNLLFEQQALVTTFAEDYRQLEQLPLWN